MTEQLRDPLTGRPYTVPRFSVDTVDTLLLLVDTVVPASKIAAWTPEEVEAAGDWALRVHLKASDNSNRVSAMPECVRRDRVDGVQGNEGTVFDLVRREPSSDCGGLSEGSDETR